MSRTNEWVDGPPETDGRAYPAGVLLRVRLGDGESGIFLVGHINEVGGLCDDCTDDWSREDIIAHKVIWDGR